MLTGLYWYLFVVVSPINNGLMYNGLMYNGLMYNGLMSNRLQYNELISDGLMSSVNILYYNWQLIGLTSCCLMFDGPTCTKLMYPMG